MNNNNDTEFAKKLTDAWTVPEMSVNAKSHLLNTPPSPSPFKGEGRGEGTSHNKSHNKTQRNNIRWFIASSAIAASLALMVLITSTTHQKNSPPRTVTAQLTDDELLHYVFATTTLEENY
jgi:anti-sigma-K factor RskA